MGFFSRLFGKKDNKETEQAAEEIIIYAEQDAEMETASLTAQQNFKYFWRALYWEYRRIIPAHDFAMVKIPFEQKITTQAEPIVEHMWINNINFDGEFIYGELINVPGQLTNVSKGDAVTKKISEIGDWIISIRGKSYGGFTIQLIRSRMSEQERKKHDKAWGLDFGDYNEILLVHEQKEHPENLIEHPMSTNMGEKLRKFLADYPDELVDLDPDGLSSLHREAIAGNKTSLAVLLELGADKLQKSKTGKTALDYAKSMNWEHLVELLN